MNKRTNFVQMEKNSQHLSCSAKKYPDNINNLRMSDNFIVEVLQNDPANAILYSN